MTRCVASIARGAALVCAAAAAGHGAVSLALSQAHGKGRAAAQVNVSGFPPGCPVELDASPAGRTAAGGALELQGVPPGDHYVHVACPGQTPQAFFISPRAGESAEVRPQPPRATTPGAQDADSRRELRRLVQAAIDARNTGNADEAIGDLRRATQLDPENADLHRELGITFLLLRDWGRARVEYLEAIKHDPAEAEAHNGLGYALEKLGDARAAAGEFRAAMQLDPDETTYREHYVEALAALEAQQDQAKKKR